MPFCRKCGAEMYDEDAFCPMCGASVASMTPLQAPVTQPAPASSIARNTVSLRRPSVAAPLTAPVAMPAGGMMSKGELLNVLQKYRDVLRSLERAGSEESLASASEAPQPQVRYHTFIKFYWPYIVSSIVSFWLIVYIAAKLAYSSLNLSYLNGGIFLAILVLLGLILGGIPVAKGKQETANYYVYSDASKRIDSYKKSADSVDMTKLSAQKRALERQLPAEITARYRTYDNMCTIVRLLKYNKVNTLQEALAAVDEEISGRRYR